MPRRLVSILSIAFVAGGVACLLIAAIAPLDHAEISPAAKITAKPHATTAPSLSDFEPIFAMDLRKPLVDPPKTDPAADALTEDSPLSVRLSGTIIEPGRSVAIFSTGLTKTTIRQVGQEINGAEVVSIESDTVTLRYQGQLRQLKLEKSPVVPAPLSSTPSSADGS